ncbi:MAG: TolC family protein [Nitrospiraceae bacterium]|nr:TolC family protein [Nitrospiraceae bacterium]
MKRNRLIFILTLIGIEVLSVTAVPAQSRQMVTLKRCLKAALAFHPSVRAFKKIEEQRAAETRRMKAEGLPQMDVALTAGTFRYTPYHYRTFQNSLLLTWNTGKWLGKLSELGVVEEAIARVRAKENRLKLILGVKQAFYQLIQSRQERRTALMSEAYLQHHLEISRRLFRLGQIDQLDLYRTQANLSSAEEGVAAATNRCQQGRIQLQNLTGLALSEADSLVLPKKTWDASEIPLDTLLVSAQRSNPALALLEKQIQQTKIQERLVRASRLPAVTLSGGFVFDNDPTSGGNYAVVQGGLQLPLVDWNQRKNQVQAFQLQRESQTEKAFSLDIRTQIEKLLAQLQYLRNLDTLKARTLSQARTAYFLTEKTYQAGTTSNTEVLLAQKEWIQAKLSRETVHLQIRLTQSELEFLIGRLGVLK